MREIVVADPDAWCRSPGKRSGTVTHTRVRCAYPGYRIKVQMGSAFAGMTEVRVIARTEHALRDRACDEPPS